MRRLLLALMLLASPAWGATYWLSPTGTSTSVADSNTIREGTAAHSLDWFNANASSSNGWIARLGNGDYGTKSIQPDKSGDASHRIRYYGNAAHPESVIVNTVFLGPNVWSGHGYNRGSYTTVRWVTCSQELDGCFSYTDSYNAFWCDHDSLVNITSNNQTQDFHMSGSFSVADSIYLSGTVSTSGQPNFLAITGLRTHGPQCPDYATDPNGGCPLYYAQQDTVKHSVFTVVDNQANVSGTADFHGILFTSCQLNVVNNNVFNITYQKCNNYFFGIEGYEAYSNQIQGNTFNVNMTATPPGSHAVVSWRDSSQYNRFMNNTVICSGAGDMDFFQNNGGHYGSNALGNNYFGGNTLYCPTTRDAMFRYYGVHAQTDTVEFNLFETQNAKPILLFTSGTQNKGLIFRHNTCYNGGGRVIDLGAATPSLNPRLTSNIYYSGSANSSTNPTIYGPAGSGLDSAGVIYSSGGSSAYAFSSGAGSFNSAMVWADPLFVNAPTDLHLSGSSPALNAIWDGYAGAYPNSTIYTVTVTQPAALGTITPSGAPTYTSGASPTFSINANIGYHVATLTVDGVAVTPANTYTFTNISANHTITATFAINTATYYALAGPGGALSPDGTFSRDYGQAVTFALTANSGQKITGLEVDGAFVTLTTANTYTPPDSSHRAHTVQAFFVPDKTADPTPTTYTITATAGAGGYVTHAGQNSLAVDDTLTFAVVPYTGYHATAFTLDGVSQLPNSTVTPTIIDDNRTVSVTFAPDSVAATVGGGDNGIVSRSGGTNVVNGGSFSCLIVPSPGYGIASVTDTYQDASGNFIVNDLGHPDGVTLNGVSTTHSIYATFAPLSQIPRGGGVPRRWR